MEDTKKELIEKCYCGKEGAMFTSDLLSYKMCFTCGQHNMPTSEEILEKYPKIYQASVEVSESDETFWPFMYTAEDLTVVLDLNDKHEKVWRMIPIVNDLPDIPNSVEVEHDDFYTVFTLLNKLKD